MLVAPFTTQKLTQRIGKPQFLALDGNGDPEGIYEACVVQLDAVSQVDFRKLDTRLGVIGKLSKEHLAEVDQALRYVFAIS